MDGLGVVISNLFGDRGGEKFRASIGKKIEEVRLDPDAGGDGALVFVFADGQTLSIGDRGRSCCESRYMTCDDDLSTYAGATLASCEVTDGPDLPGSEEHQTQFLRVQTSKGVIVCQTHNEHNGYYGGFSIACW